MKTVLKIKILLMVIFITIGIACCKDKAKTPEPPKVELSVSEVSVMLGFSAEVSVNNVTQLVIEPNNADIAVLRYDEATKKIKIETKATGAVTFKIMNQGATAPSELKVTVTPAILGLLNANKEVIFEAKYRFKGSGILHLSPSGTERKTHFLKVTLNASWKVGDVVKLQYKKPQQELQNFQATVFAVLEGKIYLKTDDSRYIIFPI